MTHFTSKEQILAYLKTYPQWISGFANGEGSFSAYAYVDLANKWGIQFGIDFSIGQLVWDRIVLEAINEYFKGEGGVYDRTCGVSVVTFRNLQTLQNTIRPFFIEYPLIGTKSFEFERWCKLVDIFYNKEHIGNTLAQRDVFLKFLAITKELNGKRVNKRKLIKIEVMSDWLTNLNGVPTKEEKLTLGKVTKASLVGINSEKE